MGKTLAAAAIALVLGAVGGALALQTKLEPQVNDLEAQLARAREDVRNATMRAQESGDRVDALQAELYAVENERAELMARLRSLETETPSIDAEFDYFEEDAFVETWDEPATGSETEDDENDRERRRGDWGNDEERREAYEGRRAQWDDLRARIETQVQADIARLGPEFAEHYAAITENRAYAEELRDQLREAETDEDRNMLIAELRGVHDSNTQMIEDVQNAMLREFAQTHNGAQDVRNGRYVRDLRELLASPMFTMEGMFVGGGRGGGGGPGRGFSGGRGASGR